MFPLIECLGMKRQKLLFENETLKINRFISEFSYKTLSLITLDIGKNIA